MDKHMREFSKIVAQTTTAISINGSEGGSFTVCVTS